jgi:hypothetical protein
VACRTTTLTNFEVTQHGGEAGVTLPLPNEFDIKIHIQTPYPSKRGFTSKKSVLAESPTPPPRKQFSPLTNPLPSKCKNAFDHHTPCISPPTAHRLFHHTINPVRLHPHSLFVVGMMGVGDMTWYTACLSHHRCDRQTIDRYIPRT